MPTGYTADVADGKITDLAPFVWQLARGMGALIMMRDDPHDAPIPERFEPSPFYAQKVAELRTDRDRLRAMSAEEAQAGADAELAEYEAERSKAEARHTDTRNRYNAMLAQVTQWEGAPEGIKEFALEQLHRGLEFDCSGGFRFWRDEPERDGVTWRNTKIAALQHEIGHYGAENAKEIERTERRNAWLAQLRASLASAETVEA